MTPNSDSFNSALSILDSLNTENATELWVPSLGRAIKFKPLTAANQRDMIATLAGTRFFPAALALTVYDVVKDTCIEPGIDIDTFNSIDKIALVLQIRAANIQDKVLLQLDETTQAECDVLNDGVPFEQSTSIKAWTKSLREKTFDVTPEIISEGPLSVEVAIPTFFRERRFQQQIYNIAKTAIEGKAQATNEQILGQVFLDTISQYISKLVIGDITVQFDQATPEQCLKLVSKIRGDLLKRVGTTINKYEAILKEMSTVSFTLRKNKFTGAIAVDNSLFAQ